MCAASKVMSEALKVQLAAAHERERTAVAQVYNIQQQQHVQQQEHQKQQLEIGALRERLERAISEKDRAVTVCTAAVEGEKLYSAEVCVCATHTHTCTHTCRHTSLMYMHTHAYKAGG